ncbi:MAG: helix-turn-helix domain-containing protein [Motilibacteraceae bacterium]
MSSPATEQGGAGEVLPGDVARAVAAWRRREGLSLERAGALLGVAGTTVRDWERGRSPRPWHLRRLALLRVLPAQQPCPSSDAPAVLAAVRADVGLTLASFARIAGCSASTVSRWEGGSRRPGREQLERLARDPRLAGEPARRLAPLLATTPRPAPAPHPVPDRGPGVPPLRAMRARQKLSLARAAAQAGVSRRRLAQAETGTGALGLAAVRRLAMLYGLPVAEVATAARCPAPRHLVSASSTAVGCDDAEHLLLVEALAWAGRSCVDLAAEVGVSPHTVRRWRRGEQRPTPAHARAAERVLGLPTGALRRPRVGSAGRAVAGRRTRPGEFDCSG